MNKRTCKNFVELYRKMVIIVIIKIKIKKIKIGEKGNVYTAVKAGKPSLHYAKKKERKEKKGKEKEL